MKNLLQNGFFLLIIFGIIFCIYQYLNHTYIKAEFEKIDPLPSRMNVFYKGYKIGTSQKIRISDDFKKTYLYITLNQRGLHLPQNITVEIKDYNKDTKYINIVYPNAPKLKYIKSGDIIKGKSSTTFSGISDINQEHLDNLSEKGEDLLNSAKYTTDSLTKMFDLITAILQENRENIYSTTTSLKASMQNLNHTTKNLNTISTKINAEITKDTLIKNRENIELTTQNLAKSTTNISSLSDNLNSSSSDFKILVPKLKTLIEVAQTVLCNINDIIIGVKTTLKKKLGGARIFFSQPIP